MSRTKETCMQDRHCVVFSEVSAPPNRASPPGPGTRAAGGGAESGSGSGPAAADSGPKMSAAVYFDQPHMGRD